MTKSTGAPKTYGVVPEPALPDLSTEPGATTAAPSILKTICGWMVDTFGLLTSEVPGQLLLPGIQPVAEVYRPRTRMVLIPNATGAAGLNTPSATSISTPIGYEWELLSLVCNFVTDATVANRDVQFLVLERPPGGFGTSDAAYRARGNFVQPASTTFFYVVAPHGCVGAVAAIVQPCVYIPVPIGYTLPASTASRKWTCSLSADLGVAGDLFSFAVLLVRERLASPVLQGVN